MIPAPRPGDQINPLPASGPDIQPLVIADLQQRYKIGVERYGTGLRAFNGRSGLRDLYEELMDALMYVRQVMEEDHETLGLRDAELPLPQPANVPEQSPAEPMTKPNRQQRRASERATARGHATQLAGYQTFLTEDEIGIVEEALALWVHQTREDLSGVKLTPTQEWALERAEKIRQGLSAAMGDRPWFDIAPQRTAPRQESVN